MYHKNTVEDEKEDEDPADKLWHIVRYHQNPDSDDDFGFKLKKNDVIKLGRVRFKITELHRGKYQSKHQDKQVFKPSEYIIKNSKPAGKDTNIIAVPQMNNYLKQSNALKKNKKITNTMIMPQRNEDRIAMLFNSKNTLENTGAEQLDAFRFQKHDKSMESSKKSQNQMTCRI